MRHIALLVFFMILSSGCGHIVDDARIAEFRGGKKAAVSLTFDDGIIDHYTLVAPHMDSLGLKGTFWVNGKFVGPDDGYAPRMTLEMWKEMSDNGHEISNHSWSHPDLTSLSEDELLAEVTLNDDLIEKTTGKRPVTFCYPFNGWNETVRKVCREGRVATRDFQEAHGQTESHSSLESMCLWLDRVVANREWGVSMTHGIRYGWDMWEDETVLWDFYKILASRQDEIWVDTFAAVASYMQERDHCTIEVREYPDCVIITPSCDLDPALYRETLTAEVVSEDHKYLFEFDPFGGKQKFDK